MNIFITNTVVPTMPQIIHSEQIIPKDVVPERSYVHSTVTDFHGFN